MLRKRHSPPKPLLEQQIKLQTSYLQACMHIIEKRGKNDYVDLDLIQIMKKEGESLQNSSFINGMIIDKEVVSNSMPKLIKNAKIALLDHSLEITKTEFDADIRIVDPSQIQAFKQARG